MRETEIRDEFDQSWNDAVPGHWKPEDLSDLTERDAESHPVQETDENRFRQEVSQCAQAKKSAGNAKHTGQEGQCHGKRDVQVGVAGSQWADGRGNDRAGGRV